jgi:hypothetical protein
MTAHRRRASTPDTARVLALASGVIKRRPRMVNLAGRLNAETLLEGTPEPFAAATRDQVCWWRIVRRITLGDAARG